MAEAGKVSDLLALYNTADRLRPLLGSAIKEEDSGGRGPREVGDGEDTLRECDQDSPEVKTDQQAWLRLCPLAHLSSKCSMTVYDSNDALDQDDARRTPLYMYNISGAGGWCLLCEVRTVSLSSLADLFLSLLLRGLQREGRLHPRQVVH